MNNKSMVDITPLPKLLLSLRSTTLTAPEAVADLLDNSIEQDVNSTIVKILKKPDLFAIIDNGCGMNHDILIDAMKLGSNGKSEIKVSDYGLFGIGLKNSSLALGRKFTIITKSKEDKHYTAIFDIDNLENWSIPIFPSTNKEIEEFSSYMKTVQNSETGTVVKIQKLDKITESDDTFIVSLKRHLGEVFRIQIKDGLKLFINDDEIFYLDPFYADYSKFKPEIEEKKFAFASPDNIEFNVRVKIYFMPTGVIYDNNSEEEDMTEFKNLKKYKRISTSKSSFYPLKQNHQGFYVMRNNRQILKNTWLGMKGLGMHDTLNRVRAEIFFDGESDEFFGVPYEKNRIKLANWLKNNLQKEVAPVIVSLRQRVNKEAGVPISEKEKEYLKPFIDDINTRANRIPLIKTIKEIEDNDNTTNKKEKDSNDNNKEDNNKERKLYRKRKSEILEDIEYVKLTNNYICEFEAHLGKLIIKLNTSHPFFENIWRKSGKDNQSSIIKIFFALGKAIIDTQVMTPAYQKMMEDFQFMLGITFGKLID